MASKGKIKRQFKSAIYKDDKRTQAELLAKHKFLRWLLPVDSIVKHITKER